MADWGPRGRHEGSSSSSLRIKKTKICNQDFDTTWQFGAFGPVSPSARQASGLMYRGSGSESKSITDLLTY